MECRICGHNQFYSGINLGLQPWGNHFLKKEEIGSEPFYPLHVVVCKKCAAAQLDFTVKKEVMFAQHTYLSGITRSLTHHFEKIAKEADSRFFPAQKRKRILDIGSNDGTQLKAYQKLGYEVLGVESAGKIAQIANDNLVPTLHAFFNLETADRINTHFDLINASGVFFHLEELHSVTEAIRKYLKAEGVFIVQFLYMKSIMENGSFDQIYHEHLLYYTLKTLQTLLNRHGLELFDAEFSPIHGGSIIGYAAHKGLRPKTDRLELMEKEERESGVNEEKAYRAFQKRIDDKKSEALQYLSQKKREGKKIYGMGAPVKGNTLLNYFEIGSQYLDCLVEKNELRRDLYSPGTHLPIRIEKEISPPDVYFVLAWNFKSEILANNTHLIEQGVEFFFPVETSSS